ncbi:MULTISPECIES: histidine phosphatase family protein [Corynebacterium]|uniref:histidine phosphatase family protein n=1 Tax=Corynebacterium TaxID=1716 RepID=UPI00195BB63C|nr:MULTISPECIES: histidine phosphatase family protein [Corynebacterium]MDN8624284.1 histidine phosphatase family protein [Corynebacterium kroppenstedtii]QRQ65420.1 histidine phosphatase family protein [Corynebacterium kroppenstedtii]
MNSVGTTVNSGTSHGSSGEKSQDAPRGRLILFRHGQTTSNLITALDTAVPGADLTSMGVEQAFTGGERIVVDGTLSGSGVAQQGDAPVGSPRPVIISSEALRARKTARFAAQGMVNQGASVFTASPSPDGVMTDPITAEPDDPTVPTAIPGLTEVTAGDLEMNTDMESIHTYRYTQLQWSSGKMDMRMPGGQSGWETRRRFLEGITPMLPLLIPGAVGADTNTPSDLIVVVHGSVMRFIAGQLAGVEAHFVQDGYVSNCRWIVLDSPASLDLAAASYSDVDQSCGSWRVKQWAWLPGDRVRLKGSAQ